MKTLILESTIHDIPMAWALIETKDGQRVSEETGVFYPDRVNTDADGCEYDIADLMEMADECWENQQ